LPEVLTLPALTSRAFLVDPFSDRPGARLYRTGDMVRRRSNGSIEFLGRRDDQIQIRGRRVELAEIESALLRCPSVVQACCRPIRDGDSISGITGHLVLAESGPDDWEPCLRRYLQSQLDPMVVPARLIRHTAFPVTKHGKIDRDALDQSAGQNAQQDAPLPDDPLAKTVALAWRRFLGYPHDLNQSFQKLGGDSLLAVKLALSLEEGLGIRINPPEFSLSSTFEDLVGLVRNKCSQRGQPVLTFRAEGEGIPIFAMYGVDGEVGWFHGLASHLRPGRKLYGFRSPAVDDIGACPSTLSKAALDIALTIRKQSSGRPVALVGFSWGGVLAMAVALHLREIGVEAAKIFLIDSQPPPRRLGALARARHFVRWLPPLLFDVIKRGGIRARLREFSQEHQLAEKTVNRTAPPPSYLNWSKEIEFAHYWLALRHSFVNPVGLPLTLFRSEKDLLLTAHPMNPYSGQFRPCWGWSHWVGRTSKIHRLPAAHVDLIKSPTSQVIADLIDAEICQIDKTICPPLKSAPIG
jgi:thioesterase domain-containing protein/acyl carrier protein